MSAINHEHPVTWGHIGSLNEVNSRLGHVTRARVTQIINLLQLAPDIQEGILFCRGTESGADALHEGELGDCGRGGLGKAEKDVAGTASQSPMFGPLGR